ncbi:hypothetical protein CHS0354_020439 [Potamilus streckersoni]|uniref:Lipase domain-containing protein n=1 Tax=Potamilus streckersoni TaxID=2493646 RepID=A0AAE0VYU8_9BIVA|nr:hypothetical protein CHS0354_020439 [Potamilus streckersoni]
MNYAQAAANTRLVGTLLAIFMKILYRVSIGNYNEKIHLIGHGLGAHVAGYAGERISMVGRITGLDPAGPLFEGKDPRVRLDYTDALYVDVIHTDGTGFGMLSPVGHVDFYPNLGLNQPECKESIPGLLFKLINGEIKEMKNGISCSHMRALLLFTESINTKCRFFSIPNENDVECDTVCSEMGYDAPRSDPRGNRFLRTASSEPFCSGYLQKKIYNFENILEFTAVHEHVLPNCIQRDYQPGGQKEIYSSTLTLPDYLINCLITNVLLRHYQYCVTPSPLPPCCQPYDAMLPALHAATCCLAPNPKSKMLPIFIPYQLHAAMLKDLLDTCCRASSPLSYILSRSQP